MTKTTIVKIPKLYENMDEATIGKWLVNEGDTITVGTELVELVTDKTTETINAPVNGILLKRYAEEKSVVPIGFAYACIGAKDATAPDANELNDQLIKAATQDTTVSTTAPKTKSRTRVAPAARALIKRHKLDPDKIAEKIGKTIIHKKDVEELLQTKIPKTIRHTSTDTSNKVVLITGASGDIGRVIAQRLSNAGFKLALHFHKNNKPVDALIEEFDSKGVEARGYCADLTNSADATKLVDRVATDFSGIYAMVHNAGALDDALTSFMTDEQWHSVIKLNLDSAFYLSRAIAMHLARAKGGKIVFVSSAAALLGSAGRSNYAAAKAGLLGLTKSLARELAASNVAVNAVCPGFIESKMTAGYKDAKKREITKEIPMRRFGNPEEVAEVITFLTATTTSYVTGQSFSVDGGLYMS